jgi:adhesin HecA-like repeat protein
MFCAFNSNIKIMKVLNRCLCVALVCCVNIVNAYASIGGGGDGRNAHTGPARNDAGSVGGGGRGGGQDCLNNLYREDCRGWRVYLGIPDLNRAPAVENVRAAHINAAQTTSFEVNKSIRIHATTPVEPDGDEVRGLMSVQNLSQNNGEFTPIATAGWSQWMSGKQVTNWSVDFTPLAPGKYRFKCEVEDKRGLKAEALSAWVEIFGFPSVIFTAPDSRLYAGESVQLAGRVTHPNGLRSWVDFQVKGPGDSTFKSIGSAVSDGHASTVYQTFVPTESGHYAVRLVAGDYAHRRLAPVVDGSLAIQSLPIIRSGLGGTWTPLSGDFGKARSANKEQYLKIQQALTASLAELETSLAAEFDSVKKAAIQSQKHEKQLELLQTLFFLGDEVAFDALVIDQTKSLAQEYLQRAQTAKQKFQIYKKGTDLAQWSFYAEGANQAIPSDDARELFESAQKLVGALTSAQQVDYHRELSRLYNDVRLDDKARQHEKSANTAALALAKKKVSYEKARFDLDAPEVTHRARAKELLKAILAYKNLLGAETSLFSSEENTIANMGIAPEVAEGTVRVEVISGQNGTISLTILSMKDGKPESFTEDFSVSNGLFASADAEHTRYDLSQKSVEIESQGVGFTIFPDGGIAIGSTSSAGTVLEISTPGAVRFTDLTVAGLHLKADSVSQPHGTLETSDIKLEAKTATLNRVFKTDDLNFSAAQTPELTIAELVVKGLKLVGDRVTLATRWEIQGDADLNVRAFDGVGECEAENFKCKADSFKTTSEFTIAHRLSVFAKTIEIAATSKLFAHDLTFTGPDAFTGFDSLTHFGYLEGSNANSSITLRGDFFLSKGSVVADDVKVRLTQPLVNFGALHGRVFLDLESAGSCINRGKINSYSAMRLQFDGFLNEDELSANGQISISGSGQWKNVGTLKAGGLVVKLSNTLQRESSLENAGTWMTNALSVNTHAFTSTKEVAVVGDAHFAVTEIHNPSLLNIGGNCIFDQVELFDNTGTLFVKGIWSGSLYRLVNTGTITLWGGMKTALLADSENAGDLGCFGSVCSLKVEKFINTGTLRGAGMDGSIPKLSDEFTLTASQSVDNLGTITGGKNFKINTPKNFNNPGKVGTTGNVEVHSENFKSSGSFVSENGTVTIDSPKGIDLNGGTLSTQGFLNMTTAGTLNVGDSDLVYGAGGYLGAKNFQMDQNSWVQGTGNTAINAKRFENRSGQALFLGNLAMTGAHFISQGVPPKWVAGEVNEGSYCHNSGATAQGNYQTRPEAGPMFTVTEDATFAFSESFRNDAGVIALGSGDISAPVISNNGENLDDYKMWCHQWETWQGGWWSKLTKDKRTHRAWRAANQPKALVGAIVASKDLNLSVSATGSNSDLIFAQKDFTLSTPEGRVDVTEFIQAEQNKRAPAPVALYREPAGSLIDVVLDHTKYYSIEENPLSMMVFDRILNRESFAAYLGISVEYLTQHPQEYGMMGTMEAYQFFKENSNLFPRFYLDPVALHWASYEKFVHVHGINIRYLKKHHLEAFGDLEDVDQWGLGQLRKWMIEGGRQIVAKLSAAQRLTPLDGEHPLVAYSNSKAVALLGTDDLDLLQKEVNATHRPVCIFLVQEVEGEWVLVPYDILPDDLKVHYFHDGSPYLGAGENIWIDVDNVINRGTISADGDVTFDCLTFKNEQPVYEWLETVHQKKGFLRGKRARTFKVSAPKHGGKIEGATVMIFADGDITTIGGSINASVHVHLSSKDGHVHVLPLETYYVKSWDPGTIGHLLGSVCSALATRLTAGEIASDGTIIIEGKNILIEASKVFAESDVDLMAEYDITIKDKNTAHISSSRTHCHGLKCENVQTETINHQSSLVQSKTGNFTAMVTGPDSTFNLHGSGIDVGNSVNIAAPNIHIDGSKFTREIKMAKSGLEGFSWVNSKTTTKQDIIYRSTIKAANKIVLDAKEDNVIEAAILCAGKAIIIRAGRDNIITGMEAKTESNTLGWSIGIRFFGSEALEAALKGEDAGNVFLKIADQDPLLRSFHALWESNGAMNLTTEATLAVIQLWQAVYEFNRVNGGNLAALGTIGQRLGLTDLQGNINPRIHVRVGMFGQESVQVKTVPTYLVAPEIHLESGRNTHISGGSGLHAKNVTVATGGDFTMTSGVETTKTRSWTGGASVSVGGGVPVAGGVDGSYCKGDSVTHVNSQINADKIDLSIGNNGVLYGANINGREFHAEAKNVYMGSPLDTQSMTYVAGGFDTAGSASFAYSNEKNSRVGTPTGIHVTEVAVLDVAGHLSIEGALIVGPDDGISITSKTFSFQGINEESSKKGIGVSFTVALDRPGEASQSSGIPGYVTGHFLDEKTPGIVRPTVVTNLKNIKVTDCLDDAGNTRAECLDGLNTDINKARETFGKEKMYLRAAVPIVNVDRFGENWANIKENLFDSETSTDEFKDTVREVLDIAAAVKAEMVDSGELSDEQSDSSGAILKDVLGETWEGESSLFTDESGGEYLAYDGRWESETGAIVEGKGTIKLGVGEENAQGLFIPKNGQMSVGYDLENNAVVFDSKGEQMRSTWSQSAQSVIEESIVVQKVEGTKMTIGYRTFIREKVLKPLFGWEFFGRFAGGGDGNPRTWHLLTLDFHEGNVSVVYEAKWIGATHRVDSNGNILQTGLAEGGTLKYSLKVEYSEEHQQRVAVFHMEGNERNPIGASGITAALKKLVLEASRLDEFEFAHSGVEGIDINLSADLLSKIVTPGITYDLDVVFTLNGEPLEGHYKHDRVPTHEIFINDDRVYVRDPAPDDDLTRLFPVPGWKTEGDLGFNN